MKKDAAILGGQTEGQPFAPHASGAGVSLYNRPETQFEMIRKDKSISLRMPEPLLDQVKEAAKAGAMPYQRFIRLAIERALLNTR